jgi:hypothetical protein
MTENITCKFFNEKYKIGVTADGKFFALLNGKVKSVVKEIHCGSIHYRIKGTAIRASKTQLNNPIYITQNKVIQQYCPF